MYKNLVKALVALLLLCLNGCAKQGDLLTPVQSRNSEENAFTSTVQFVEEVNRNSNFGDCDLLVPANLSVDSYDINHSPHKKHLLNGYLSYAIAGNYPQTSDEITYTQINLFDDCFNILGATVGQSLECAEKNC